MLKAIVAAELVFPLSATPRNPNCLCGKNVITLSYTVSRKTNVVAHDLLMVK